MIGDLPGVEGVHAPIINMALVPSNSVRKLVNHRFDDDRYIPYNGEIIVVRLSKDLVGPVSSLGDLPFRSTRCNCHHLIVLSSISHLTSTGWLPDQPADFQQIHIPLP